MVFHANSTRYIHISCTYLEGNCLKKSQRAMQYFALLEECNEKTKDKLEGHHPE